MSVSTHKPFYDYVLVETPDRKTAGGLVYVQEPNPSYPRLATVLAVGDGRPSEYSGSMIPRPPLQVGQTILMHGAQGMKYTIEGTEYRFIRPADIIAVIE